MLLIINIGNSSIHFGLFKIKNNNCIKSWIISSIPKYTINQYFTIFILIYKRYNLKIKLIKNIIIGSVVPLLTNIIKYALYKIHKIIPIIIDRYTPSPIFHKSHELGTDLYANAVSSFCLYKRTSLIIDFGTAISLTCIEKTGNLKGVIIIPGVKISLNALIKNTAQLSKIKIKKPKNILGLYSESCIQSGIIYGYLSMIEGLIERINNELKISCYVIATGSLSHIYFNLTNKIHILDKMHTIKGIKILYEYNN